MIKVWGQPGADPSHDQCQILSPFTCTLFPPGQFGFPGHCEAPSTEQGHTSHTASPAPAGFPLSGMTQHSHEPLHLRSQGTSSHRGTHLSLCSPPGRWPRCTWLSAWFLSCKDTLYALAALSAPSASRHRISLALHVREQLPRRANTASTDSSHREAIPIAGHSPCTLPVTASSLPGPPGPVACRGGAN